VTFLRGPRYSFAPIDHLYPISAGCISQNVSETSAAPVQDIIGISGTTVAIYRRQGMSSAQADRAAVRLGLNPVDLWPSWYDDAALEPPCRVCGLLVEEGKHTCSAECRLELRRRGRKVAA